MKKITGTLLNMDGKPDKSGDIFNPDSVIIFPDKVPVFLDNILVGSAAINKNIDQLKYEIAKNFSITDAMLQAKPCISGFINQREGNVIKKCTITSISMDLFNQDDRIKKMKDDK